ncbi:hypothetical protein BJ742DRAFT_772959 [Cladochytrium replicatum]|nr:hypothetical protein BJ742DRAFT_772959 [Cladochytrium replicatum]
MEIGLPAPPSSARRPGASLFHQCLSLTEKLYRFPNFDFYLFPYKYDHIGVQPDGSVKPFDPVQTLWDCLRLGAPLAQIFNHYMPSMPIDVPDVGGTIPGQYKGAHKKPVMQFLLNCKKVLDLGEEESQVILSDLYNDDTNGFLKFLKIVERLLDRIEQAGLLPPRIPLPFDLPSSNNDPADNRSKLVAELIETERKYVSDLQELKDYQKQLMDAGLSKDKGYQIFANLDGILDFQRKFLVQMEATLALNTGEQRLGQLFSLNEEAFRIYEAFCGNYDYAVQKATEDQALLTKLSPKLDPVIQLPSYLIKPVQRICKYPLFLNDLIKMTDANTYYYMDELKAGLAAVKRITDNVNEQKRRDENRQKKADLAERVDEWKGLNPEDFGELVLCDKFMMSDQEYQIYLFQKILLCCKDLGKNVKPKKENRRSTKEKNAPPEASSYSVVGNIGIDLIAQVSDVSGDDNQTFALEVEWYAPGMTTFTLKCRNEEQVRLWKSRMNRLMETSRSKRGGRPGDYGSDPPPTNRTQTYAVIPRPPRPSEDTNVDEAGSQQGSENSGSYYDPGYSQLPVVMPDGRLANQLPRSRSIPLNVYPAANSFGSGRSGSIDDDRGRPVARKGSIATRGTSAGSTLRYANSNMSSDSIPQPSRSPRIASTSPGPNRRGSSPPPPMPAPYQQATSIGQQGYAQAGGYSQQQPPVPLQRRPSRYGPSVGIPMPPPMGPLPAVPQSPRPPNSNYEYSANYDTGVYIPPSPPQSVPGSPGPSRQRSQRRNGPKAVAPIVTGASPNGTSYRLDGNGALAPPKVNDRRDGGGNSPVTPTSNPLFASAPLPTMSDIRPVFNNGYGPPSAQFPPPTGMTQRYVEPGGANTRQYMDQNGGGANLQRSGSILETGSHPAASARVQYMRAQNMPSAQTVNVMASPVTSNGSNILSSSVPLGAFGTPPPSFALPPTPQQRAYGPPQSNVIVGTPTPPPNVPLPAVPQQLSQNDRRPSPAPSTAGSIQFEREKFRKSSSSSLRSVDGPYPSPNAPVPPVPVMYQQQQQPPTTYSSPLSAPLSSGYPSSPQQQHYNTRTTSTISGSSISTTGSGGPASSAPSPQTFIKVRTHFQNELFVIAVPVQGCSYESLYVKIERKIRLCMPAGSPEADGTSPIAFQMRYKDEDGDNVRVDSDEDIQIAFDNARKSAKEKGVVNLYVTLS